MSRRRKRHSIAYRNYLQSAEWRRLRATIIKRAEGRCERCGRKPRVLEVHHLHYRTLGRETGEELEALCRGCHAKADWIRERRNQKGDLPPDQITRRESYSKAQRAVAKLDVHSKEEMKKLLEEILR